MDLRTALDSCPTNSAARHTTLLLIAGLSPEAGRSVGACIELARALDADVIVLHVHERNAWLVGTGDFKTLDEADQYVNRVSERIRQADVRVRAEIVTVRSGRRGAAISAAACRAGIDLVLVGVQEPSALDRLLGRGFVDRLVRRSSRPVLAIG